MKRGKPSLLRQALTYAGLTFATGLILYPVALVLKKAFEPGRDFALSPSPIPQTFSFENFQLLMSAQGNGEALFVRYAFNSAVVALATTAVGVVLACTAAYALSRHRFAGQRASLATFRGWRKALRRP